jgi:hypothetical protein
MPGWQQGSSKLAGGRGQERVSLAVSKASIAAAAAQFQGNCQWVQILSFFWRFEKEGAHQTQAPQGITSALHMHASGSCWRSSLLAPCCQQLDSTSAPDQSFLSSVMQLTFT